jgi:hypothetical protein
MSRCNAAEVRLSGGSAIAGLDYSCEGEGKVGARIGVGLSRVSGRILCAPIRIVRSTPDVMNQLFQSTAGVSVFGSRQHSFLKLSLNSPSTSSHQQPDSG